MSELALRGTMGPGTPQLAKAIEEIDQRDAQAASQRAAEGVDLARAAGFDAEPLPVKENGRTWRAIIDTAA